MESSLHLCSVLFLLLFKFTLIYQTGYNTYKSGSEYFCVYSRPGAVTLRRDISYARDWLNIDINEGEKKEIFLFNSLKNKTIYASSEKKFYKFINRAVATSINNDTYMKSLINETMSNSALYYKLYFKFGEVVAIEHQYPLIFEDKYKLKGEYFYTTVHFIEEDCSLPNEISIIMFQFYLALMKILSVFYLFSLIPTRFKKSKGLYYVQVLILNVLESLDLKVFKVQKYCYNKNYRSYNSVINNFVIKFNESGKFSDKINEWGLHDSYVDNVLNKIYIIQEDYLIEKDISGGNVNISRLDLDNIRRDILKRVFWANLHLGYPVVKGQHCLSVNQILTGLRAGLGFSLCLTKSRYFGEDEVEMCYFLKISKLPQILKEKLVKHNKLFFKTCNTKCLMRALSSTLYYYNRPKECLNSQWKMYVSDCNYIMSDFGFKLGCFDQRKETNSCKEIRGVSIDMSLNDVELMEVIYESNQLSLNSQDFNQELNTDHQKAVEEVQSNCENENTKPENLIIPYNELGDLKERVDELYIKHGPILNEFKEVLRAIEDGSGQPLDNDLDFIEAISEFNYNSIPALSTCFSKMQNNVKKKKKYSSLPKFTTIGQTDLNQSVSSLKLKSWLNGVNIFEIYPTFLRIKEFISKKFGAEIRKKELWEEIYGLLIQSDSQGMTIETAVSESISLKRIKKYLNEIRNRVIEKNEIETKSIVLPKMVTVKELKCFGFDVETVGLEEVLFENTEIVLDDFDWEFTIDFNELCSIFGSRVNKGVKVFLKKKKKRVDSSLNNEDNVWGITDQFYNYPMNVASSSLTQSKKKTDGKLVKLKYDLAKFKFIEEVIDGGGHKKLLKAHIENRMKRLQINRKSFKKYMLGHFKINKIRRGVINRMNLEIVKSGKLFLRKKKKDQGELKDTNKCEVLNARTCSMLDTKMLATDNRKYTDEELSQTIERLKTYTDSNLRAITEIILREKILVNGISETDGLIIPLKEIIKVVNRLKSTL